MKKVICFYRCSFLIVLGVVGGVMSSTVQAEFLDDASGKLTLRNFYLDRNYVGDTEQARASGWTQSFLLDTKSGFTDGTVGFGLDALGLLSVKLDGGRGMGVTQLLPVDADNGAPSTFGRLALAAKVKFSETELKVGEWSPVLPILSSDDGRSLPQTFRGAMITSKEINNLTLFGGQVQRNSQRNDSSMEPLALNALPSIASGRFDFVGAEYALGPKTRIGAWHASLEDIYYQNYVHLSHSQTLSELSTFTTELNYYSGGEAGSAKAGNLDNRTVSGLFGLHVGPQGISVGLQKVSGDSAWMRIAGTNGSFLANSSYQGYYDNPNERSWQLRYDFNFVAVGLPGFTFMTRYLAGDGVKSAATVNGTERQRDSELAYVVQSGALKGLDLRWRNSTLRRNWGNTDSYDENRLIINYPISLF